MSFLVKLRRTRGQAALEMISVFLVWFLTTTMFVNLMLYFSSVMLIDSALNRAALQASSYGCLYVGGGPGISGSTGVAGYFQSLQHLGVRAVSVNAYTVSWDGENPARPADPAHGGPSSYYSYWQGSNSPLTVAKAGGSSVVTADCSASSPTDATYEPGVGGPVPSGGYIVVRVHYTQDLWLFGTQTINRWAVVVSHSLQGASS